MNIRISAIATSVMLVTVMPRNSRQFFSQSFKANPAPGGAGPYTENGTQYPGQVYSEVNTLLNHRRKWNFRSGCNPGGDSDGDQRRWFGARRVFGIDTGSEVVLAPVLRCQRSGDITQISRLRDFEIKIYKIFSLRSLRRSARPAVVAPKAEAFCRVCRIARSYQTSRAVVVRQLWWYPATRKSSSGCCGLTTVSARGGS